MAQITFWAGVSSEIFQRKLHEALNGLDGIFTIGDDIIVAGCGETDETAKIDNQHKQDKLYQRCNERHIVLNESKKVVGKEINFHGHKITDKGILPDENKIKAVLDMKTPENISDIKRLCGLVQYMAKFLPHLADTQEPLRNLTRKNVPWNRTTDCKNAFENVKKMLTQAPVLAYYNPDKDLVVQVDSSQDGLGAVLLQEGKPLEFASRSLKPAERNWAQIE